MFKVVDKKLKVITVYDIRYKSGYPFFVFYEDGEWRTKSAKEFKPYGLKEII